MNMRSITAGNLVLIALCAVTVSCARGKASAGHLTVQSNVEMTETNINSQIPGKIQSIPVKEGDMVKKGQRLMTIDSDTLNAQLAQAQARIQASKAQRDSAIATKELAEASFQRVKQMWDKGAITRADYDDMTAKRRQAESGLDAIEAQLAVAEGALAEINSYIGKASITAPVSGLVSQINVESGELVTTGMPLLVIIDNAAPWIQCSVRETDLSKVRLGQEVDILFAAYKDRAYKGKVVRINKDADFAIKRATNDNGQFDIVSYGVKVEILEMDQPLYSGMTAIVDFGK